MNINQELRGYILKQAAIVQPERKFGFYRWMIKVLKAKGDVK